MIKLFSCSIISKNLVLYILIKNCHFLAATLAWLSLLSSGFVQIAGAKVRSIFVTSKSFRNFFQSFSWRPFWTTSRPLSQSSVVRRKPRQPLSKNFCKLGSDLRLFLICGCKDNNNFRTFPNVFKRKIALKVHQRAIALIMSRKNFRAQTDATAGHCAG